jgi:hypothetical protein
MLALPDCGLGNSAERTSSIEANPNPASNYIAITYNNRSGKKALIMVTDVLGKKIMEWETAGETATTHKSVAELPPGMYNISLVSAAKGTLAASKFKVVKP